MAGGDPVERALEDVQRRRPVDGVAAQHHRPTRAVVLHHLDRVERVVHPVERVVHGEVDRQSGRVRHPRLHQHLHPKFSPGHVMLHFLKQKSSPFVDIVSADIAAEDIQSKVLERQRLSRKLWRKETANLAFGAVHPGGFDARLGAGLGPVELAEHRVGGQRGGRVDAARDDAAPVATVGLGGHHLALERRRVHFQPVQVLRHPVVRQGHRFGRLGERHDVLRVAHLHVASCAFRKSASLTESSSYFKRNKKNESYLVLE